MSRRHYWLRLKEDFFQEDFMMILQELEDGEKIINYLLKLMLFSVKTNGYLRLSKKVPYTDNHLATIFNKKIDFIRKANFILKDLDLLEILDDDTLYLPLVHTLIGSESESAERVRNFRARKFKEKTENKAVLHCNGEIEKEIEKENIIAVNSVPKDITGVSKQVDDLIENERLKDIEILSNHLWNCIIKHVNPPVFKNKNKKLTIEKWISEIDKLNRIDGILFKDIYDVITWALQDDFWQNNIWSGAKLRKQYDKLYVQMKKKKNKEEKEKLNPLKNIGE